MLSFQISAEVNREQIKDHLRRAEREHLVRQAMDASEKTPVWQNVKGQLSRTFDKWQSSRDQDEDGAYVLGRSQLNSSTD